MARRLVIHDTVGSLSTAVADVIAKVSDEAIRARGRFTIAFSGGSLPQVVPSERDSGYVPNFIRVR